MWSKIMFGPKNFFGPDKKVLILKKLLDFKNFGLKNILCPKKFGLKKIFGQKKNLG